nr:glycosyltransferase [Bacteroidota bacterium]
MMVILYSIFIFLYCILILKLYISWENIDLKIINSDERQPQEHFISIIIPVRNEANNILPLLYDINKQETSPQHFEVIVVDDASTDGTIDKVLAHKSSFCFDLKVLYLKVEAGFTGSHKKKGLTLGIEHSKGDYILTTDGDCRVQPHWLTSLRSIIIEHQPECITGPVTFENENSIFKDMQIMEFAFLIGTGASS